MTNGNVSGRSGSEPVTRPEPREARTAALAPAPRAAGARPESLPALALAPGTPAPAVTPRAAALTPMEHSVDTKPESPPAVVRAPESVVRAPDAAVRAPDAVVVVPEASPPVAVPRASVLGPTLRFRGELSAHEDLVVHGSVEGSIAHAQSLTIGTDGSMTGDIRARVIVIDGRVDGNLHATETVHIRATAKVRGDLLAPRIAIQDGAFFQGQVQMPPRAPVQERGAGVLLLPAVSATPLAGAAVDLLLHGTGT